jgi:hypothetical protein
MAEAKKGRGCFFYGCLTLVILVLVIAGVGLLGAKMALNRFTSTTRLPIPPPALSPQDGNRVVQRVRDFTENLKNGKNVGPLELNSDELDYVIRNLRPDFRDTTHVVITNNRIHADYSMPLFLINPALKGRFYNGSADFTISVRDGALDINSSSPMPGMKQNMHWSPGNRPGAEVIRYLEKIEFDNDKVTLVPKTPSQEPAKP